jgi:hypothetical protein
MSAHASKTLLFLGVKGNKFFIKVSSKTPNNPKRHQTVPKALFIVFSELTDGEGLV